MTHVHWTRPARVLGCFAVAASAFLTACDTDSPSEPEGPGEPMARPHDVRSFSVPEGQPTFEALDGATSYFGVYDGLMGEAGYRFEVPDDWNGILVMHAHGYAGTGPDLSVTNPGIRAHLIESGYAWGASSYSANYYDVRSGVEDTNRLALEFEALTGMTMPDKYYITGVSMGGHVTAAAIEAETEAYARYFVDYSGAVPMCAVVGDRVLYDYFYSYNVAAHHLAGVPISTFPIPDHDAKLPEIKDALWVDYDANTYGLTEQGAKLQNLLMYTSGGPRPVFANSFGSWQDLLLGYGADDATWNGILSGVAVNTMSMVFQLDADPALSAEEETFNDEVYRVDGDFLALNPLRPDGVRAIPILWGEFDVPVVELHGLGDLFVPFRLAQVYKERAIENGSDSWLVQRAIRTGSHCAFSVPEQVAAFDDMVVWDETGSKPAGDDFLDPMDVADPNFGCQFTLITRASQFLPECP